MTVAERARKLLDPCAATEIRDMGKALNERGKDDGWRECLVYLGVSSALAGVREVWVL